MDSNTRKQRRADLGLTVAMIAVSAAVWWEANKLAPAPFDPLGPKSFPMWIAATLGLLSFAAAVAVLCGRRLGRSDTSLILGVAGETPADYALRPALALTAAAMTVAYVAVLTFTGAGFLWATIAYVGALGWAMSDRTRRHAIIAAAIAVVGGSAITYLFTKIFILDLP